MINIYNSIFRKKDLELQEKKFALAKEKDNPLLKDYIYNQIQNVSFSINEKRERKAKNLIEDRKLMGWCYEATTFLSPFIANSDVYRGSLKIWSKERYNHAWIKLNIDGVYYCFDPALNYLCRLEDYYQIFDAKVSTYIKGSTINKKLLNYLNLTNKVLIPNEYRELLELFRKKDNNGIIIEGSNTDINDAFYHVFASVNGQVENDKIKTLTANFLDMK